MRQIYEGILKTLVVERLGVNGISGMNNQIILVLYEHLDLNLSRNHLQAIHMWGYFEVVLKRSCLRFCLGNLIVIIWQKKNGKQCVILMRIGQLLWSLRIKACVLQFATERTIYLKVADNLVTTQHILTDLYNLSEKK